MRNVSWAKKAVVALTVALVSCGPGMVRRPRTVIDGFEVPINVGGCSSVGVPNQTQADIDFCKPFLAGPDWRTLDILHRYYTEVTWDGVHNGST